MGVVLLGLFMSVLDTVIVSIALPGITTYFGTTVSGSQWVVTAYLLTMTALLLVFGKLATYKGLKKMFLGGLVLFTVSSLGCGMATSLPVLIAFRLSQAIGGAMASSISMALIFRLSPPDKQGKSMGIMSATVAIASLAGPGLGGILIDLFDWRAIFLINIPAGIIALLTGIPYFNIGDERKEKQTLVSGFDWQGAICFAAGITALTFMLNAVASDGLYSTKFLVTLFVALLAFALLIRNERKHSNPILDITIFKEHMFSLPLLSMILFFAAIFILNITMPFYLEEVLEFASFRVGLIMMVIPVILVLGSPVTGWLYDRISWQRFAPSGQVLASMALLLCAWAVLKGNVAMIIFALALFALGYALFQSPNNIEIMRGLHKDKATIASSIANTGRHFGMAVGASFASLLLSVQLILPGLQEVITPNSGINGLVISSSVALIIAAVLCAIAAWPSYLRNR